MALLLLLPPNEQNRIQQSKQSINERAERSGGKNAGPCGKPPRSAFRTPFSSPKWTSGPFPIQQVSFPFLVWLTNEKMDSTAERVSAKRGFLSKWGVESAKWERFCSFRLPFKTNQGGGG